MKRTFLLLLLVAIVASGATVATQFWIGRVGTAVSAVSGDSLHEDHAWLHRQLNITAEQEARLAPAEMRFAQAEAAARARLTAANRTLAESLSRHSTYTTEVAQSVDQVHVAQSELQKVALEHYFELLAVLTPEQTEQLRQMMHEGLMPATGH